jgi:hypothetical protein
MNRAIAVTEAAGTASQRVTALRYDGNDNVVNDRRRPRNYDRLRCREPVIRNGCAAGHKYVLDGFGNVVTRYDGFGLAGVQRDTFEYDTRGRMTSKPMQSARRPKWPSPSNTT